MLLPFVLTAILASVGADYDDSLASEISNNFSTYHFRYRCSTSKYCLLLGNIMFPLASAAYGLGDTIQQCLDKHLPGTKVSGSSSQYFSSE